VLTEEIVINVAVLFDLLLDRQLLCGVFIAVVYAIKAFCKLFPVANVNSSDLFPVYSAGDVRS